MLRTEQAHAQLTFSRSVAELLPPAFKLCLCSLRNALLVEQHKCENEQCLLSAGCPPVPFTVIWLQVHTEQPVSDRAEVVCAHTQTGRE